MEKILSIIPAPGWFALIEDREGPIFVTLACWVLVEDDEMEEETIRYVTGMSTVAGEVTLSYPGHDAGFVKYVHETFRDDVEAEYHDHVHEHTHEHEEEES